ncbi:MAG: hypothetical protein KBA66_01180 [Leptospiraceae bacterium]|nr:hypothetical protein [Leptospiraceae bacterium]
MVLKSLLLLITLFILTCEGKKSEYKDLYTLKTLVDNAYKSQTNPQTACETSTATMQTCAASSPEFSALTLTETIFISTFTSNQYTTYSAYCTNKINSSFFSNQSDARKECNLKCETTYWQTRINLNTCTASFPTMLNGLFGDSGFSSCVVNCATPTNNNP